jgi:hypothetical protein
MLVPLFKVSLQIFAPMLANQFLESASLLLFSAHHSQPQSTETKLVQSKDRLVFATKQETANKLTGTPPAPSPPYSSHSLHEPTCPQKLDYNFFGWRADETLHF